MANREKGEVSLEIAGETYTMVLDINALVALEDVLSTPEQAVTFTEVLARINGGSIKALRALVWAALQQRHPEMTLEHVGALIQKAGGIAGFGAQLAELTKSTVPDGEDLRDLGVASRPPRAQARKRRGNGGVFTSMPAKSA